MLEELEEREKETTFGELEEVPSAESAGAPNEGIPQQELPIHGTLTLVLNVRSDQSLPRGTIHFTDQIKLRLCGIFNVNINTTHCRICPWYIYLYVCVCVLLFFFAEQNYSSAEAAPDFSYQADGTVSLCKF